MNIRYAVIGSFLVLCLAGALPAQIAGDATLESRIDKLEKQLVTIEAQLGKLDFIAENLEKLRSEDLPRLSQSLSSDETDDSAIGRETAKVPTEAADPAIGDLPLPGDEPAPSDPSEFDSIFGDGDDAADDSAARKPAEDPLDIDGGDPLDLGSDDPLEAGADDPLDLGGDDPLDLGGDDARPKSLEARTTTIEKTVAAIEKRLKLLDAIAEAIDAIRNEDLAQIRQALGQSPRAVTAAKPESPATGTAPLGEGKGMVVINNWTGQVHWVTINGQGHRIEPGRNRIPATVGQVKTVLAGRQIDWDDSHWKKVGDEYRLVMDLNN